jgi:hypothetical protein
MRWAIVLLDAYCAALPGAGSRLLILSLSKDVGKVGEESLAMQIYRPAL